MKAYELLAYLRHLTLVGQDEEGMEWVGTYQQWNKVESEIETFERI